MGTRNSFSGIIDEMHIYAKALPSAEVQKLYVKGLEKLFENNAITQAEYDQKMEEFEQSLASATF
jgi:HPt (histidine-containing phosphotransfer) domain-containing protein